MSRVLEGVLAFHYAGRDFSTISEHSYLLSVTRAYLPRLIPVEVDEPVARAWFKSLLSGIEFLHIRGVVHNDIKWVLSYLEPLATLNVCQTGKYSAF